MGMKRKKGLSGQMFLIAAIMVVIGLLLLKNLTGIYDTAEEKRYQESTMLKGQLKNIMSEYKKIVGVASMQQSPNGSAIAYLANFSDFLKNDAGMDVLYMLAYSNNSKYSVTLGNFIGDKINVTLTASNSTPLVWSLILNSSTNATKEFTSSGSLVNITLTYVIKTSVVREKMPVFLSNKKFIIGWFDIIIKDDESFLRSKDIYNRTW
jgi:hypothetical protein